MQSEKQSNIKDIGMIQADKAAIESGLPLISTKKNVFHWYAVYTRPRAEKIVNSRLVELNIEVFLPLYKTLRKWSDRKKIIEKPLFSSYIFVNVNSKEQIKVLRVDGVVKYISFENKAVAIPEAQINNLKLLIGANVKIDMTSEKLEKGDNVEVVHGILSGLKGELVRIKNKNKVVVRIDRIDQNLIIDIPAVYLKKL